VSSQFDMFDAPVEQEAAERSTKDKVIRRKNLIHSIIDCHRVEDAWWQRLQAHGIKESSSPAKVCTALALELADPPVGIEAAAWERIAESYRTWSTIFGDLQLFWQLRRKRDE
jgi:hypothetical protein